ncbi:MAG: glycogen debranching enzyme N-terminal domain-containing protein [Verrucomicrobiae bacterium]|nr:glycogen debranching enzyme N-terminal domain-containing protein [Verrucomicrobiae bacterium]
MPLDLSQIPSPGRMLVAPRGDLLEFRLDTGEHGAGRGYLRTNLGCGAVHLQEIVDEVELGLAARKVGWRDLPMDEISPGVYSISVRLDEVGRFMGKTFFDPADGEKLLWPAGDDVVVKVEPADTVCSNTMYSAFVRQFGAIKSLAEQPALPEGVAELDAAGYAVIPPSGKFRDLVAELDFIVGELGFRIIQVLPVFPVPSTYARMGRFGSPFAALDFEGVDPALAEFDRKTTPLDQFRELADEVHARQAKLFIDIPINHTGWASWLQNHHPDWFVRDRDEHFQSPGAWGVTWEDLSELNYEQKELWMYVADVFLFWCREGVDGFRCDAGYMVPAPVWRYVVAKVRREFPDTIFFLEGLGGPLQAVETLLDRSNINWAYSEMFQTEGRDALSWKLDEWTRGSLRRGIEIHFAETHDNNRMAERGETYSRLRVAMAALASVNGGYGIMAGVEWFAKAKVLVHGAVPLNWGAEVNQVDWIRRINAVLATHVAFADGASLDVVRVGEGEQFGLVRRNRGEVVLVLVNLDLEHAMLSEWGTEVFSQGECFDLLSGERSCGGRIELAPGMVRCLSESSSALGAVEEALEVTFGEPHYVLRQRVAALEADVVRWYGCEGVGDLLECPEAFCEGLGGENAPVMVQWNWSHDATRVVVVPRGWGIFVKADARFSVSLSKSDGDVIWKAESFQQQADKHFALLPPIAVAGDYRIEVVQFGGREIERRNGRIYAAPDLKQAMVQLSGDRAQYALCTNDRGAMSHVRGAWGEIRSQYDALLAANLHDEFPVDRQMLLVRCRAWIVYRDYSRELCIDCQTGFGVVGPNTVEWRFDVPVGGGKCVGMRVESHLQAGKNLLGLRFHREPSKDHGLDGGAAVRLVVRPDVDDRGFHEKTKAFAGPEAVWAGACSERDGGFRFAPGGHALEMIARSGEYQVEPEWIYNVGHPVDASRGLGDASDLFSPGYFDTQLVEGESFELLAAAVVGDVSADFDLEWEEPDAVRQLSLAAASKRAIADFVVKRDDTRTVIAGYPWFLDWGRDTLICLRGMISAGMLDESLDILKQFAKFEKHGTLPNMIRGGDDSNRDTSDAPLWFFVSVGDLIDQMGEAAVLGAEAGGRTLTEVMLSIGRNYRDGTPNGIHMDPESGLIFSPSHYTWMDTNHPAGTPRVGYPIEIQALWFAAVKVMAKLDPAGDWQTLAGRVQASIVKHYYREGSIGGYLSDCLHAESGQAAAEATADDHLRPNQLFAITLGAVTDKTIARGVVKACEELLVPGGVRSLADRPVKYELPVYRDGVLLNQPNAPYWGRYEGDEDTRRKPGYHNGTVWNWPFPSYAEALYMTYGDEVVEAARSILASAVVPFNQGCLAQLPEIMDGDAPHQERGCGAQAWSVTELYRVLEILD